MCKSFGLLEDPLEDLDFPDSAREIGRTGALLGNLLFTKISSNTSTVRPRPLLFVSPSGSNGRRWKRFNNQHCGTLFHLIFGRQYVHPHAGGVQAAVTTSASTLGGQTVVETTTFWQRSGEGPTSGLSLSQGATSRTH